MENHSLTINISKNNAKACFHGRTSGRTDVLKLSLIIMRCHIESKAIRKRRQLGMGKFWETLAIAGNWEWGNVGNWESLAIGNHGNHWQLGI